MKFIPYYGNKRKEYKVLKKYLEQDNSILIDVFGGSGSISCLYKNDNQEKYVIYNDIKSDLVDFLKMFKDRELIKELNENVKKQLNDKRFANKIDCINYHLDYEEKGNYSKKLLIKYLYKAFNNNIFITRTNNDNGKVRNRLKLDLNDYKYEIIDELLNQDYNNILQQYKENENVLLYLDPPYFKSGVKYDSSFNKMDLENIIEYMKNCKCKVLLNIDDNYGEIYNGLNVIEIYNGLNVIKYDAKYETKGKCKAKYVKHLIITNY
jgi:site-specific DNA-adenine methylase